MEENRCWRVNGSLNMKGFIGGASFVFDNKFVLFGDIENLESKEKIQIPEDIKELIEERKKAREEKNWQLSDLLRDQIKEKGYIVKDTKEGMTIDKI